MYDLLLVYEIQFLVKKSVFSLKKAKDIRINKIQNIIYETLCFIY